jgi:hypothetical protein
MRLTSMSGAGGPIKVGTADAPLDRDGRGIEVGTDVREAVPRERAS